MRVDCAVHFDYAFGFISTYNLLKMEVEFKFDKDNTYTIRFDESGDTIFGMNAHKVMYAMWDHERKGNNKLSAIERVNFILAHREQIIKP